MGTLPNNIYDRILAPREVDTLSSLWSRIYFYPGRPPQSAELNEMQTILLNEINRLGRTIFREGARISGAQIVQKQGNLAGITEGTLFLEGRARLVAATTEDLQLTGVGYEVIGIRRSEIIKTPDNDQSLLNPVIAPTVGLQQFNRKGALRQILQYSWTVYSEPTPAVVIGSKAELFTIQTGINDQVSFSFEGATITVVLTAGQRTASEIVQEISTAIEALPPNAAGDPSADVVGGRVQLKSAVIGSSSSISVLSVANSAYSVLGFTVGVYPGTGTATSTNTDLITVYEFRDGNLITSTADGEFTNILKVMARRTYDEAGHYLVNGLRVSTEDVEGYPTQLRLKIDTGKAYVEGFEIAKINPSLYYLDKAIDSVVIEDEIQVFDIAQFLYPLSSIPVKQVDRVAGRVLRLDVRVIKGTPGGIDDLFGQNVVPYIGQDGINIVSIDRVMSTPSGGAAWSQSTDWLKVGNTISWSPGGGEPAEGNSYWVNVTMARALTKGKRIRTIVTQEARIKGADFGADALANTDLIRVLKVESHVDPEDPAYVEYTEGVEFVLDSGRTDVAIGASLIDWGLVDQPTTGATYYVTYEYWNHSVEGDYVTADCYYDTNGVDTGWSYLDQYGDTYTIQAVLSDQVNLVDFRVAGGDTPVNASDLNFDYKYYLPRRDTISLKSNGEFAIHRGVPDRYPTFPPVSPSSLPIAFLDLPANSSQVTITHPETMRFTMQDHWQQKRILDNQVYQNAINALEQRALSEITAQAKKGLLADPFIDFSRSDLSYHEAGTVKYVASINPELGRCGLPQVYGNRDMEIDTSENVSIHGSIITLAYNNILHVEQKYATEEMYLNPYDVFDPMSIIKVTPDSDYWMDTVKAPDVRIEQRVDELIPVVTTAPGWVAPTAENSLNPVFGWVQGATGRFWAGAVGTTNWGSTNGDPVVWRQDANEEWQRFRQGTEVDRIVTSRVMERVDTKIVDKSVVPFMRQRVLTVESVDWLPLIDNIEIYFDGIRMAITPGPGFTGSVANTVRSNESGYWSCTFVLPAGVRSGRREITAQAQYEAARTGWLIGAAVYAAEGMRQTVQTTFTSITTVQTRQVTRVTLVEDPPTNPPVRVDPIAQSFVVDKNTWVTSLGIYFSHKPLDTDPVDWRKAVTVQIRDMSSDGYPTMNVLAQKTLTWSQISVSTNSSAETQFIFDDPVYLQAGRDYCLAILTDGKQYRIWISRLGGTDLMTNSVVAKQPYIGVLFKSANAVTWDSEGYLDVKFRIYAAKFNTSLKGTIVFKNVTNMSTGQIRQESNGDTNINVLAPLPNKYSRFTQIVTQMIPPGARALWYYSTNNGNSWQTFNPGSEVQIGYVPTQLKIKCEMDMQSLTGQDLVDSTLGTSPAINRSHIGLGLVGFDAYARQVERVMVLSQTSSTLKVMFITSVSKNNVAPNHTIKSYYTLDEGLNWVELTNPTETVLSTSEYERVYDASGLTIQQVRVRCDITQNDNDYSQNPWISSLRVIAS